MAVVDCIRKRIYTVVCIQGNIDLCRTVVEMEGLSEEEEVEETLRIHKEVLAGVKLQPWPIER